MNLTPTQITEQLDRYIIGQASAKRAVAVALRNRYRRNQLPKEVRDEITPKNIIMKGPTGVGKTEIARRLARLVGAPFVKVEATKYTEVGYVGRDVESIIRDLVEVAIRMVKERKLAVVEKQASDIVDKRMIKYIVEAKKRLLPDTPEEIIRQQTEEEYAAGRLDKFELEIDVSNVAKPIELPMGMEIGIDIGNIFGAIIPNMPNAPRKQKRRSMTVEAAREQLMQEECDKLIDKDSVQQEGMMLAEQEGIVFIDEIDKIASVGGGGGHGPEVSREGVQRDILPIVEGCTVQTKYGAIKTDYILFIAAGAFHISRIQDLIPELQGRFPIRVELQSLNKDDFLKILTQPENAITKQYQELLRVDGVDLAFDKSALKVVAELAEQENDTNENLGARRLHNIMEILLEEISFKADGTPQQVKIDKEFVEKNMSAIIKKTDLRKYVL